VPGGALIETFHLFAEQLAGQIALQTIDLAL